MKIALKQNSGENKGDVPYFAHIEITEMTIDHKAVFDVPIYTKNSNGSTIYSANICGFEVDANSPEVCVNLLEKLVPQMVQLARFPTYVFIARRSLKMYPVYTVNNEVVAVTPSGPVFRHVELAKVREYVTDYLNEIGELGVPGKSEKLHVRGVRMTDLSLTRPVFYLKKRAAAHDENEFWAPVFINKFGTGIYAYAANGRREVDLDDGHEALRLRMQAAQALIADKRLKDEMDLRADRFLPDYWKTVEKQLEPLPSKLAFNGTEFDMYKSGNQFIAVEHRSDEDRYSIYVGRDKDDLRERAARDLTRRGIVNDTTAVKIDG